MKDDDSKKKKDDDLKKNVRDSWSTEFDPSLAIKQIEPTKPVLSWDDYVVDEETKRRLQQIYCKEKNHCGSPQNEEETSGWCHQ